MPFKSYRKESRSDWGKEMAEKESLSVEQLQTGALLRLADATEMMAKNYTSMQANLDWYKNQSQERHDRILSLEKQVSSLKGVITKLKKKQAK